MNIGIKLYRELDEAGYPGGFKIPGLIKEDKSKTEAERRAERLAFEKSLKQQSLTATNQVSPGSLGLLNTGSINIPIADPDPWHWDTHTGTFPNSYPPVTINQPNTYNSPHEDYKRQAMYDQMVKDLKAQMSASKYETKKTPFEEIVDALFTNAEKEQVLIDLGWRFYMTEGQVGMMERGDESWGIGQINVIFLREISIKFKNLLLSKATLKIKI